MPKIFNPKAWYLAGVGAVALAAESARRLVRRRRAQGAAGYRAVEVDVEVKPPPVKKPAAKAAAQPKPTAEVEEKVAKALESVADEAKAAKSKGAKAAKKAEAEVEDAAKDAKAKVEDTVAEVKATTSEAKTKAGKKATVAADKAGDAVADTAKDAKAAAKKIVAEAQGAAKNGKDAAEEIVSPARDLVADAVAETRDAAETMVAEVKTRAKAVEAAVMPDDLTQIKGIGPAFAKRLAEAGYTTYAGIANATPEALREATHAPAIANPDEWIAGARARM